jgi:hypothetical protein
MREPPPPATLSDVRDGIAKLCRDIGSLQGEVNELSNMIGRFKKGRMLKRSIFYADIDWGKGERETTPEPDDPIDTALRLLQGANTVEQQTLLMKAVSRSLDGALRDVRSAKLDVKAILDDPDLGDEFRKWTPG